MVYCAADLLITTFLPCKGPQRSARRPLATSIAGPQTELSPAKLRRLPRREGLKLCARDTRQNPTGGPRQILGRRCAHTHLEPVLAPTSIPIKAHF